MGVGFFALGPKEYVKNTYPVLMERSLSVRIGGYFCSVCSSRSLLWILWIALILCHVGSGQRQPRVYFWESYHARGRGFLEVQ